MAKVLSCDRMSIVARIRGNPHLQIVHSEENTSIPLPPTAESVMDRSPTPGLRVFQPSTFVKAIDRTEELIHEGLENFGVPADTLQKLRSLSGLEVNTGQFLAQSVLDTQTLYTIELYKIPARLDYIKKNYLELPEDRSLPPMEQMFWQRAYTELLEQLGKGKDRMIQGAEAIGAMIKDAKEKEESKNGKKTRAVKPGW